MPSNFHQNELPASVRNMSVTLSHGLNEEYVVAESEYTRYELNRNNVFAYARWDDNFMRILLVCVPYYYY